MQQEQRHRAGAVLPEGALIGEYVVERLVAQSGFASVYRVSHPTIGKTAAAKVLSAEMSAREEDVARFVQEAKAVNRIGHSSLIDVFSFGSLPDGRSYYLMEWVDGQSLAERLETGAVPLEQALRILLGTARALVATHSHDIVHRDLKPGNIMLVSSELDATEIRIVDFGIAKWLEEGGTSLVATQVGLFKGTPAYAAPEQATAKTVDARADLYALGAVAYELVCGEPPFEAGSAMEILHKHIHTAPVPPRQRGARISQRLEALILKLLAKEPAERSSLEEVIGVVEEELEQLRRAGAPEERGGGSSARLVKLIGVAGALVLVGIVAVVVVSLPRPQPGPAVEPVSEPTNNAPTPGTESSAPSSPVQVPPGAAPSLAPAAKKKSAPAKARAKRGRLTVLGKPWVRVLVDGREVAGETPLKNHVLPVGLHTVTVEHPSGFRRSLKVRITANEELRLMADVFAPSFAAQNARPKKSTRP